MQIKKVTYSALANLGDYQNERLGMVAYLEEGDSPEAVIDELRRRVQAISGPRIRELRDRQWELTNEISNLERKLQSAQDNWIRTADFLKAQGIKTDPPEFPEFVKLLNPAAAEEVEVVEAEEYDEDEDSDSDDEGPF